MKRILVILGVLGLASLTFVLAASASKPAERFFLFTPDTVLSGPCSFDVNYEVLANKEYGIAFSDGRFLITGTFKVRLTNLSSPSKSLDVNISGPGILRFGDDGSVSVTAWGNWLFYFNPGMFGPGSPGKLLLTSGFATEVLDANGNVASWNPPNRTRDACALLS
jgi:hypothetical protein